MASNFPSIAESAIAFGLMLRRWRKQQGWTQYTACSWAEAAGFKTISYGNLSVIEQGKAGELRHKAFLQLEEINRRIAEKDWRISDAYRDAKLIKAAVPIGDEDCPVWGAVEFWSCYIGRRQVPPQLSD